MAIPVANTPMAIATSTNTSPGFDISAGITTIQFVQIANESNAIDYVSVAHVPQGQSYGSGYFLTCGTPIAGGGSIRLDGPFYLMVGDAIWINSLNGTSDFNSYGVDDRGVPKAYN